MNDQSMFVIGVQRVLDVVLPGWRVTYKGQSNGEVNWMESAVNAIRAFDVERKLAEGKLHVVHAHLDLLIPGWRALSDDVQFAALNALNNLAHKAKHPLCVGERRCVIAPRAGRRSTDCHVSGERVGERRKTLGRRKMDGVFCAQPRVPGIGEIHG